MELADHLFAALFISSFMALVSLVYHYGTEREDEQ